MLLGGPSLDVPDVLPLTYRPWLNLAGDTSMKKVYPSAEANANNVADLSRMIILELKSGKTDSEVRELMNKRLEHKVDTHQLQAEVANYLREKGFLKAGRQP